MANEITGNNLVGIPGIGTQSSGWVEGSKWQMAIAVPLRNYRFNKGQVKEYTLSNGDWNDTVGAGDFQAGIIHSNQNQNSLPTNFIQYGDRGVLGPSSVSGYEGKTESVRLITGHQGLVSGAEDDEWEDGTIEFMDRKNKYQYGNGDSLTIYGTGCAHGWDPVDQNIATLGMTKGYSSMGMFGRYSPGYENSTEGKAEVDALEKNLGNYYVLLNIVLPYSADYDASVVGNSLVSRHFSQRGLGPWRETRTMTSVVPDGTYDWGLMGAAQAALIASGVLRYVRGHTDTNGHAQFAYQVDDYDLSSVDLGANCVNAPVITVFPHPGGIDSDFAQALYCFVNGETGHATEDPADTDYWYKEGILRQRLIHTLNDSKDMKEAYPVGGTYYRLGLTWQGSMFPTDSNSDNSKFWAAFKWSPVLASTGNMNHYTQGMISTDELLGDIVKEYGDWKYNMVSGYVPVVDTDDLMTAEDTLVVDLVLRAESLKTYMDASNDNRGTEMLVLVDQVWLEHQGDIPGASGEGYVEIDHFPEMGTLQVYKDKRNKPTLTRRENGTLSNTIIAEQGAVDYWIVEGDFLYVSHEVWTQFQRLEQWQDAGHRLVLHPFLPEVPHALVGFIEITNVQKNFWDINKVSFHFKFTETD